MKIENVLKITELQAHFLIALVAQDLTKVFTLKEVILWRLENVRHLPQRVQMKYCCGDLIN